MQADKNIDTHNLSHLTNEELVRGARLALEEIQNRGKLCDILTELSYNEEDDVYDRDYSNDNIFKNYINDFKEYEKTQVYDYVQNKKKDY